MGGIHGFTLVVEKIRSVCCIPMMHNIVCMCTYANTARCFTVSPCCFCICFDLAPFGCFRTIIFIGLVVLVVVGALIAVVVNVIGTCSDGFGGDNMLAVGTEWRWC